MKLFPYSNLFCTIYEKEHIFKIKIKGAAAQPVIGNLTQSKQRDLNFPIIWGGELLWGADKVKVLFRGLSEIYLSCYNLFLL